MRLIVHPGVRKSLIHPEIYGHFSEHLGRCIYGGVFVGKDSPIPNVNGIFRVCASAPNARTSGRRPACCAAAMHRRAPRNETSGVLCPARRAGRRNRNPPNEGV